MKIGNKEYKLKFTVRAMFVFEQITKKPFKVENTLDEYIYLYSMILANNPECTLDFNDFIDAVDKDINIMQEFHTMLSDYYKQQSAFKEESNEEDSDSKKKS